MRLMLGVANSGAPPEPVVGADTDRRVSGERLRLAHCAADGRPTRCCSCSQRWPCPTRLNLDEICDAARQRYAAQVHAGWFAGIRNSQATPHGSATRH
jgi:hypothetical protein